jgi:hypothetical protein
MIYYVKSLMKKVCFFECTYKVERTVFKWLNTAIVRLSKSVLS